MVKGRPLLRWAGFLLVCVATSFFCIEAQGEKAPVQAPAKPAVQAPESGRPDLIKIDTLAAFGKLELPPVTFFHDKHTDVLLKEKKTCAACHLVEDGKLSLSFKRQKATKPAEIKEIYHAACIGCHMDMAAAGKKTGPPDGLCRSCHNAEPPQAVSLDAGLDKVVHFRHVDSKQIPPAAGGKDNCASCHHELDKQTKKLVYAKGKEETCRDCHLAKPEKGVKSLEQAAHLQCVQCHLDLANQGVKDNGPYLCAGCHSAAGQALIAKKNQEVVAKLPNKEVPRLKRGQPDAALITSMPEEGKAVKAAAMDPVAFDHKAHEKYNNNCRVCHHAGMEACGDCHTVAGSKEGGSVTLEKAMHSRSSQQSCIGCHDCQTGLAELRRLPQPYQQGEPARGRQLPAVPPRDQLAGSRDAAGEAGRSAQTAASRPRRDHPQKPEDEPRHLYRGRHPGDGGDQGPGGQIQARRVLAPQARPRPLEGYEGQCAGGILPL